MATTSGASGAGGGNDTIVRGELVEKEGRSAFVALRRLRFGTPILNERPLMLIEADPDYYIRAPDADPRLAELAEALGDPVRLAAYIAFKQLHERKQREVLDFWPEDLEEKDPLAKAILAQNRMGTEAFVQDRPDFEKLIYWNHFIKIASIFQRFGIANPDGCRAIYGLCSHIRHSCKPNTAWFTLRKGFPKGRKTLHVIAIDGIPRGEDITVCTVDDNTLLLPRVQRSLKIYRRSGLKCECVRCGQQDGDKDDEKIHRVVERLELQLGVRPPTDDSTKAALQSLKELDKLLPFSMMLKAKSKVLVAQAIQELSSRAAWQEDNKDANIIMWSGLDASNQEQRLKDTKKLYENASKDFEYLLGQDASEILDRLEAGYGPVHDQHKVIARYQKEKEKMEAEMAEKNRPPPQKPQEPTKSNYTQQFTKGGQAIPPAWEDLFR